MSALSTGFRQFKSTMDTVSHFTHSIEKVSRKLLQLSSIWQKHTTIYRARILNRFAQLRVVCDSGSLEYIWQE